MGDEPHYMKRNREAAERVAKLLALPLATDDPCEIEEGETFDPWDLFPSLYGTYSGEFDKCAIEVLIELHEKQFRRDDLGAYMFREMLCTADLCEYGTSPRVCFATTEFARLLPDLIQKWRMYSLDHWGVDVCAEDRDG